MEASVGSLEEVFVDGGEGPGEREGSAECVRDKRAAVLERPGERVRFPIFALA